MESIAELVIRISFHISHSLSEAPQLLKQINSAIRGFGGKCRTAIQGAAESFPFYLHKRHNPERWYVAIRAHF